MHVNRDGIIFWQVERGDSLSGLVKEVFGPFYSHQQWMAKTEEILRLNSGLVRDPNSISPGHLLILARTKSTGCLPLLFSSDLAATHKTWSLMSKTDKKEISESSLFLNLLLLSGQDPMKVVSAIFDTDGQRLLGELARCLELGKKPPPHLIFEIEILFTRYITELRFAVTQEGLALLRRLGIQRLKTNILFILDNPLRRGYDFALKSLQKLVRHAGLVGPAMIVYDVTKSTIQYWNAESAQAKDLILKRDGLRIVGDFGGGVAGGALAAGACAVFAAPTFGASIVGCGLVGMAGSFAGSVSLGAYGEYRGQKLHESVYPVVQP